MCFSIMLMGITEEESGAAGLGDGVEPLGNRTTRMQLTRISDGIYHTM